MKTKGLIVVLLLVLVVIMVSGCTQPDAIALMNRENIMRLSTGMTRQEALDIMGIESYSTFTGQTINNPYRSEVLSGKKGKTLELLFYYTDRKRADSMVTEDELTPLIFDDGKLIGWGWNFLETNAQKYEIRIR